MTKKKCKWQTSWQFLKRPDGFPNVLTLSQTSWQKLSNHRCQDVWVCGVYPFPNQSASVRIRLFSVDSTLFIFQYLETIEYFLSLYRTNYPTFKRKTFESDFEVLNLEMVRYFKEKSNNRKWPEPNIFKKNIWV